MGKKILLVSAVALVLGFVVGVVFSSSFLLPAGSPLRGKTAAASLVPASPSLSYSPQDVQTLDTEDNALLLQEAGNILQTLKRQDYAGLSAYVHPSYGVQFTPYSTVQADRDLRLSAEQIAVLGSDSTLHTWGVTDGSGEPIRMSGREYFARYVFNVDYTQAPIIGIDTVMESGNALENVADSYPECRFVEYHFPGIDPQNKGFDWCSLKLVFSPCQDSWRLVGIIHSEWTI